MNTQQQAFLDRYVATLAPEHRPDLSNTAVDYFCGDEYNANLCADLILEGKKTATCSLAYWYQTLNEPMPKVGSLMLVTLWDGTPSSVIQVTEVTQQRFCDVSAEFAAAEGEGDQSLQWWRDAHWKFFSKECQQQHIEMTEEMPLILERFRLVYNE